MESGTKRNSLTFAEKTEAMETLKKLVAEDGFEPQKTWKALAELLSRRSGMTINPRMVQEFATISGIANSSLVTVREPEPAQPTMKERLKLLESHVAELQKAFDKLFEELRCDKEPMPSPLKGDQDIDCETTPVSPY